jgi:twitching motility protein PilT
MRRKFNKDEFEKVILKNYELEGSDIHFGVGNKIGLRIMGKLKKQEEWGVLDFQQTRDIYDVTLSYLQPDAKNFVEREMAEHGHVGYAILVQDKFRFRVNAAKYNGGYYIVMRTLTSEPADLSTLGFSEEIYKGLSIAANKKAGLFLVVGPTGSGKSTTLSAMIKQINQTFEKNIITLEDPVEYTHQEINSNIIQKELGRDMPTFFEGLKAALREDPDVILVGEIRDGETLNLALKASETGHLVLSTLHTDNTVSTIQRITSMTDNEKLTRDRLSSSLIGVIAQRLEPVEPRTKEEALTMGMKPRRARIINYEMLTFNSALSNILKEGGQDQQIAGALDNTPYSQSYNQTLINYVKDNVITEIEALKIATDKKDMQYRIQSYKESQEER